MKSSTERSITTAIRKYLKSLPGLWYYKTHGGPFESQVGCPDILCCYGGMFYGFEVKQEGKYPTKVQKRQLELIVSAGGKAGVVRSVDDVKEIMDIE